MVRDFPHIVCVDLHQIEDMDRALTEFARDRVQMVVINGGDGTVDAVITDLITTGRFQTLPLLALLPGGTTNMTANDIGLKGRPDRSLYRLGQITKEDGRLLKTKAVRAIEVDFRPGEAPLYGFFFGTSAITRTVLQSSRYLDRPKLHASLGVAATFGGALMDIVLGRGKITGDQKDNIFQGEGIGVAADGASDVKMPYLLNMVTTLDHLLFHSKPFWGTEEGALHYMAISYPPAQIWRAVYSILWGGKIQHFPSTDYISKNAREIRFSMSRPFVLDGEVCHPCPGKPVVLREGPELRFVTWDA